MLIIERFEGEIAVLEADGGKQEIARAELPQEAREGDVLRQTPDGYCVDTVQTAARREQIQALYRRVKKV